MPAPSLHRYGQVEKCVVVSHTHLWVLCNQLINFIFHRYKNINMKNIISFSTLILFSVALNAQSLSGTQTLPGTRGGAMAYTMLNWKVNYQFVEKNGMFYLSINNPSVSVANNSLYGSYSKSALGLSVWPDSDPGPYNFSIEVTIVYPGGSQKLRAQMDAFTAGVFIGSSNDSEFKTLSVSSFKVSSAGNMNYNGGRDGVVDKLIEEKKYAGNKTNGTQSNNSQNNSNNSQDSISNSSPSTSSTITNTQPTIDPNDPNPMTNGTSGNHQVPKSSSSNSNKQLTMEEEQLIQQGVAVGTELISDGLALISDGLDLKKQRRESQSFSETDKVMAIGYSFSMSSWLGIDVSVFNPGLGKLGWGVTGRFDPSVLWGDYNVGLYGDYRDHYLYDDDFSYELLKTGKKGSFYIGGSLNIGLTNWLFVQIGGGIGSVSTYNKYEITNAESSFRKDYIGDKFYSRKDEDRIMGFCNENNIVLRFTNVLCLKTGFATYNLNSPEFTFGILFMPGQ
jgi:hypothetical protein